jgi:chromosome partitioning protein
MTKVLAVIGQKGGTGKTTLATNLAAEAARRGLGVILIDLDPQVSACNWKDLRGDGKDVSPMVLSAPLPHLERQVATARDGGADLVIIDVAGKANDALGDAAKTADLVLVPLQPTPADIKTAKATLKTIRLSEAKAPVRAVWVRVKPIPHRQEQAVAFLAQEAQGLECLPATLGERVVYQDAYGAGQGVIEAEPGGKAAEEIHQVYMLSCQLLDMPASGDTARDTAA